MSDVVDRESVIKAIAKTEVNFSIISDIDFSKYKKEIQEIVDNIVLAQIKAISELKGENKECPYFDYEVGTCRRSEV